MPHELAFKWWEDTDPRFRKMSPKYKVVNDLYSADPDVIRTAQYIIRKAQGEHADNHADRLLLAKVIPLLATIADGYTGRIDNATVTRTFGDLGDPKDPDTLAGKIWTNADGRGTNYGPLLSRVATQLTLKIKTFGLIEGYRRDLSGNVIGSPTIRVIPPENVPIVIEDEEGNATSIVVQHMVRLRESVFYPGIDRKRFTVYSLDGFAVFEIQQKFDDKGKPDGEEAVRVDSGVGEEPVPYGGTPEDPFFYYDTTDKNTGDRILPIFSVSLPVVGDRYAAYTLASQNLVYINHASELQNKHRMCNLLRIQVVTKDENDRKANEKAMKEGSSVFWIPADANRDNQFVEPDATSLRETREWLRETLSEFLFSALRSYEDSVKGGQKTATEAAQDAAEGEHSYLNTLAGSLDEFEVQAWKRIVQIEYPDEISKWGSFTVSRKRNFRPLDAEAEGRKLRAAYFGDERVPVGSTGRESAARKIAEADDIAFDEQELIDDIARTDRETHAFDTVKATIGI